MGRLLNQLLEIMKQKLEPKIKYNTIIECKKTDPKNVWCCEKNSLLDWLKQKDTPNVAQMWIIKNSL